MVGATYSKYAYEYSGLIGEVQSLWIARGSHGGEGGWFWNPVLSGGGCLMDYGTHAVASRAIPYRGN